jgi:hypothetical protein
MRFRLPIFRHCLAIALIAGGMSLAFAGGATQAQSVGPGPCGLSQAAFCDTFDQPAGTGNRSGQLNGTVWGVSRTTGNNNLGGSVFDAWSPTQLQTCSGTTSVQPDNDIIICNGQVREATTDNGNVTTLAMYPKQPFDFAGRTGIVTFDVSNDTQGSHAAWPEFWITDQPIPAPFAHLASWLAVPRNGLGIRLAGYVEANGHGASCPEGSPAYVGVSSAITVSNYVANDMDNGGTLALHGLDCVKASSGPGQMNHYEIHVSQSLIDIYGTDAGTTSPLKHLASLSNANLTFTRGVVWIEDAHYNANKFSTQGTHTFAWDNVGFDGPVVARDLTFDVPDQLTSTVGGTLNLGWFQAPNAAQTKTITGVTNVSSAAAALLTFNFSTSTAPTTLTYVVNGHTHTAAWPYPDTAGSSWRTLALPVPVADVLTGANTVSIASDQQMTIANVDLILAGAGGSDGSSSPASQEQPTSAPPTAEPTSPPQAAAVSALLPTLSHASVNNGGGDLAANQISLRVPSGVVGPSGGELNLLPLDPQSVPAPAAAFQATDTAFAIALTDSSTGTQISHPSSSLALEYQLSDSEINQSGGDPSRFQVVNWSGAEWVSLGCTTDAAHLDCAVPHLGLFALVLALPASDAPDAGPAS